MVSGDGICIRSLETLGDSCGWPYAFHVQGAQMLGGLFRRQLPGPNLGDAGRGLGICILSDRHLVILWDFPSQWALPTQGSYWREPPQERQPVFSLPFSLRVLQGLLHALLPFVSPPLGAGTLYSPEEGLDGPEDALEGSRLRRPALA